MPDPQTTGKKCRLSAKGLQHLMPDPPDSRAKYTPERRGTVIDTRGNNVRVKWDGVSQPQWTVEQFIEIEDV